MLKESREFQIFAKPVGAECNLRCSYCYYLGKKLLYHRRKPLMMSDETLENYVYQHIMASTEKVISFSWHGGEPLLAGIDFFRKIVFLQRKFRPEGRTIINGIQTNGTLLDEKWCNFLASENFTVGISIDGPDNLHNSYRRTIKKSSTFGEVLRGYKLLKNAGVQTEILCVVNAQNVRYPYEVYNFFRQLNAKYITFIPLVERMKESAFGVTGKSVPSQEFGIFLCKVFDEWIEKDIGSIKIQIFEEAARPAFNQDHTLCIFKVNCGGIPVVEHNGDFFSCDHYVTNDHLIGNIRIRPLAELLDSDEQQAFGMLKSGTLPEYCKVCEVLDMCNGECPKNRFINTPDGEKGLNYLCSGYKQFFNHYRPFVEAISALWQTQNRKEF
jgi:uncharacterized protein